MKETSQRILASLLPASGFMLCLAMAARADTPRLLPVDQPASVRGIDAACTGIGDREENEARWKSYPLKLEAVGGYGQWLADERVTLRDREGQVLRLECNAPWVLIALEPGRYSATVSVPDAPAEHVRFTVPRQGQRDVIVRFSSVKGGEERPAGT